MAAAAVWELQLRRGTQYEAGLAATRRTIVHLAKSLPVSVASPVADIAAAACRDPLAHNSPIIIRISLVIWATEQNSSAQYCITARVESAGG